MNVTVNAEYSKDGDILLVDVFVVNDSGNAYPDSVADGVCELVRLGTTLQSAVFSSRFGNSDGPFKIAFNHPSSWNCEVRVHCSFKDGTSASQVATVHVLDVPGSNVFTSNDNGDR